MAHVTMARMPVAKPTLISVAADVHRRTGRVLNARSKFQSGVESGIWAARSHRRSRRLLPARRLRSRLGLSLSPTSGRAPVTAAGALHSTQFDHQTDHQTGHSRSQRGCLSRTSVCPWNSMTSACATYGTSGTCMACRGSSRFESPEVATASGQPIGAHALRAITSLN
jgi:hypothetical protein